MSKTRMLAAAFAAAAVTAITGVSLPVAAQAAPSTDATYFNQVAVTLKTTHHNVYVDQQATSPLSTAQQQQLDSQIKATHHPIYVLQLDGAKVKALTQNDSTVLLNDLHQAFVANGSRAHVIGVATSAGFVANAYNAPAATAREAGPDARSAYQASTDPFTVYSTWVNRVAASVTISTTTGPRNAGRVAPQQHSVPARQAAPPAKHGTPGWVILVIILGVLVLAAVAVFVFLSVRRSRRKARITTAINDVRSSLFGLEAQAQLYPAVKTYQTKGYAAADAAEQSLAAGNVSDAEKYLGNAQTALQNAEKAGTDTFVAQPSGHTTVPSGYAAADNDEEYGMTPTGNPGSQPQTGRPQGVRVRNNSGQTVVINTTNYQTTQQPGFDNYWRGGNWNGMYLQPGWYSEPFWGPEWTFLEMAMLADMADDRRDDQLAYQQGYNDAERNDAQQVPTDTSVQSDGWNDGSQPATGATDGAWNNADGFDQSASPAPDPAQDWGNSDGFDQGSQSDQSDQGYAPDSSVNGFADTSGPADNGGFDASPPDNGGGFDGGGFDGGGSDSFSGGGDF